MLAFLFLSLSPAVNTHYQTLSHTIKLILTHYQIVSYPLSNCLSNIIKLSLIHYQTVKECVRERFDSVWETDW